MYRRMRRNDWIKARVRLLLVQLADAMIFAVAQAINREHKAIQQCRAVIFDVGSVSHLGVTTALALENAVEEAVENGRDVYVVGAEGTTQKRLETFGLYSKLANDHTDISRGEALKAAVTALG